MACMCAETFAAECGCGSKAAERYEAYEDPISDRQEYKIKELGGKLGEDMTRSEASDYIKKLQGRESGTWRAESGPLPPDPRVSPLNTGLYSPSDTPEMAAEDSGDSSTLIFIDLSGSTGMLRADGKTIKDSFMVDIKKLINPAGRRQGGSERFTIIGFGSNGGDGRLPQPYGQATRIICESATPAEVRKCLKDDYLWSNLGGTQFPSSGMINVIIKEMFSGNMSSYPNKTIILTDAYPADMLRASWDAESFGAENPPVPADPRVSPLNTGLYSPSDTPEMAAEVPDWYYDSISIYDEDADEFYGIKDIRLSSDDEDVSDVIGADSIYLVKNNGSYTDSSKTYEDIINFKDFYNIPPFGAESFGAEYDYDFQNQTITTITADNEAEARETFAENYDATKEEWKIVGLRRTLVDGKPSVRNIDSLPDDDDDDDEDEDEDYQMDNFGDMEYIILRLLTDEQLEDEYGEYMEEKEIGRKDLPQQLEDDYMTDGEAEYLREKYLDEEYKGESFGAESKFDKLAKEIAEEYEEKGKSPKEAMEIGEATAAKIGRAKFGKRKFAKMGKKAEDDIDFDKSKADRNKDGRISDWERAVGNAVAKGIRESKRAEVGPHVPTRIAATTTPRGVVKTYTSIPAGDGHVIGQFTPDMDYAPSGMYGAESLTSSIEKGFGAVLGIMSGLIVGGFAMGAVSSLSKDDENRE